MKKSKYVQRGTTNDLETVGIVETKCENVLEFIHDAMIGDKKHIFTIKHSEPVSVLGAVSVKDAEFDDEKVREIEKYINDYFNRKIHAIRYRDGCGGVEFEIFTK